jgi:leader peptidase (prepilin peptidase) / N-methyltransferase
MIFLLFLSSSALISFIDAKHSFIPDFIVIPSIVLLAGLKWFGHTLLYTDLLAMLIVFVLFLIPILLGMNFGGGDLRFGVFCALLTGLDYVGYFIALSGILHLLLLFVLQKKEFGFAPAMSVSALGIYGIFYA